ncbi:heparinase II/III domain-containing protein [Rubritalea sp.]|uniref:heparinase II/III domain-containing protein n=1 Tax=Rubritalea sp. TaxID=2109375 RepID=UPI003EF19856
MKLRPFVFLIGLLPLSAFSEKNGSMNELTHPRVLVSPDERGALLQKIDSVEWTGNAFRKVKAKVDSYVSKVDEDPKWMTSRMFMNWETGYTQAITKGSRTVGGKGSAPVPTPRFTGARDWKSDYSRFNLEQAKPFNDKNGLIWMRNSKTGKGEWVEPALTGHNIENRNAGIMSLAQDAAFVYWVTGEERYAKFATDILWTYMEGFQYTKPPLVADENEGSMRIIGSTSFEVIHDNLVNHAGLTYDFLFHYIAEREDVDGAVIEQCLKRMVDRIIDGGGREGNWNLHQARSIAYAGLALQDDAQYSDGRGRQYYVDIVLNADLPRQKGLIDVIGEGFDLKTGIWPEASGYGFDTTANIIEFACLLANDPQGRAALETPVVQKAMLAQTKLLHPNGWSNAVGDTSYKRVMTRGAEMLLSWAIKEKKIELAQEMAAIIQQELEASAYDRNRLDGVLEITRYAAELPVAENEVLERSPTYFAEPLDIVMLENRSPSGDPKRALSAAMFGSRGGHMHANGLAVELYGAGHVLGVDPGRGSSYWQPDHRRYYLQMPAHNTVIPMGDASYNPKDDKGIRQKIEVVEPAFGKEPENPHLTYLTSSFELTRPEAQQQRTLALVRVNATTAFYFDVFSSKLQQSSQDEYHDWFYHGMAQSIHVTDVSGESIEFSESMELTQKKGNMEGYNYFKNEQSLATAETVRATFPLEVGNEKVAMDLWMLGEKGRTLFKVEAPPNRAARNYSKTIQAMACPTLLVRQKGEANSQPFVAVYEPYLQADGAQVRSVTKTGENLWRVSGENWRVDLKLMGAKLAMRVLEDEE